MYLYIVVVFRDGYDGSNGEVYGHYRTLEDAIKQGEMTCADEEMAVFNVYRAEY